MGSLKIGMEFGIPFPGLGGHESVIFTNSLIVCALILIVSILITRKLSIKNPSKSQVVLETIIKWIADMMENIIGEGGSKFLPLVASLFLYILISNYIGLVPGFVSPTSNININFSLALIVFLATPYVGIRTIGLKNYLKHKMGPIIFIAPIIFIIETLGEFFRPVSLTLRLFGNIQGEEILIMVINKIASMIYYIPITVIILPLTLITGFLQAFIFTILPIIYFAGAVGWGEEEH
jgi:F-type H+-transporting ATPase subunit a